MVEDVLVRGHGRCIALVVKTCVVLSVHVSNEVLVVRHPLATRHRTVVRSGEELLMFGIVGRIPGGWSPLRILVHVEIVGWLDQ